ncbi:hypothetical protein UlMin_037050 [Ulmus minor]
MSYSAIEYSFLTLLLALNATTSPPLSTHVSLLLYFHSASPPFPRPPSSQLLTGRGVEPLDLLSGRSSIRIFVYTNTKLVKKLAKKYHAFLASEAVIKQIPHVLGPGLNNAKSLESKVNETKEMVKFQLKKLLCMGAAIFQNVQVRVNFLVSLLKNWQNVRCLYVETTMGKPQQVLDYFVFHYLS